MVPASPGKILVAVIVAMRENVEPRPLLVADHHRERVLKLFAEADVQHAGIQGLAPHARVEPARARPGPRDGSR